MKPFNLEDALNGAPVCTRDGREVTQLVRWDLDGSNVACSDFDLFMTPVKKTGWVAREKYTDNNADFVYGMIYPSETSARMNCPNALSVHKIEWEE